MFMDWKTEYHYDANFLKMICRFKAISKKKLFAFFVEID